MAAVTARTAPKEVGDASVAAVDGQFEALMDGSKLAQMG
jgi:hypothetical protein